MAGITICKNECVLKASERCHRTGDRSIFDEIGGGFREDEFARLVGEIRLC